jgi:hypothetical protein
MGRGLTAAGLFLALGAPATSPGAETLVAGPFTVVHSARGERAAKVVAREAPAMLRELAGEWGGEYPHPVTVVLLDRPEGGDPAPPGGLPEWFSGAAIPHRRVIYLKLASALRQGPGDIRRTLAHELSHLYLRWRTGERDPPRWMDEGLAMRQAGEYDLLDRVGLSAAAVSGGLIPLAELEDSFPPGEWRAALAYAQSHSFVLHLLDRGGRRAFLDFFDWLREGVEVRVALERAFGGDLATLEEEWRAGMMGDARWVTLLAGGSTFWSLATLLFLVAYLKKKVDSRRLLREMESEEEAGEDPPAEAGPGGEEDRGARLLPFYRRPRPPRRPRTLH